MPPEASDDANRRNDMAIDTHTERNITGLAR